MAVANRFAAAGVPLSKSGFNEAGDILCIGLEDKYTESVVDVTFINPTCATAMNIRDKGPAVARVEADKVDKYSDLYRKIGITSVRGLAIDRCGNVGPALKESFKQCGALFTELSGPQILPSWSNWTCPTFALAWGQALVVNSQVEYANLLLRSIGEVHASRVTRANGVVRRR